MRKNFAKNDVGKKYTDKQNNRVLPDQFVKTSVNQVIDEDEAVKPGGAAEDQEMEKLEMIRLAQQDRPKGVGRPTKRDRRDWEKAFRS